MTMLPAAYISDVFNIPGPRLADVDYYRNKRKMKDRLAEKGIRVIRDIDPPVGGAAFPLPCVVKRPDGAAALGVQICRTAEEFEGQRDALAGGSLLEEYVEGDFFHVDGAFNEHGLAAVPHAYLNNCYNHYVNREPLGSVGIDDQRLKRRLLDFAEQVLRALPLPEGVFHLEIIRNKNDELVFLEIACRLGGGEIYTNFLDVYGVDLVGYSIDSQLGLHPKLPRPRDDLIAGTLLMNNYSHFPGLFSAVRMGPLAEDNCMYAARIPKLGRRVADRTYDFISFVFRGKTSEAVCDSISDVISNATLESVAVPD
jgi:biotin carboxylase